MNIGQMEQLKEHMLKHTKDWDYAYWLLSQIMDDVKSKDNVDLIKAGFTFHTLMDHIVKCKCAEDAMQDCLSKIRELDREMEKKKKGSE